MDWSVNKKNFEQNGFVVLKDILTPEEAELLRSIGNELENFPEQKGKWMIYYENEDINKKARLENFINYHETLKTFLYSKVLPLIKNIYDKELVLFKDKMNWKRPGGKGFDPHQDQPAWSDFKPNIFHTLALFIDTSTKEKGCLEFVENCNKKELISYDIDGTGGLNKEIVNNFTWNIKQTTPRDILFFNSYVPHRSGDNNTNEPRRILYFTFNDIEDGDYYIEYINKKRMEFPPRIERDNSKKYSISGNKYNLANPIG